MLSMVLSASDIEKITKLARLNIDFKAKEKLLRNLNELLARLEIIDDFKADSQGNFAMEEKVTSSSKLNNLDQVIDIDTNKI